MNYAMHLRLLLVEDDEIFERFVRSILEEDITQIHHARTMEDVRREIGMHNFDVIVLDLGLPDSKRPETIKAIPAIKHAQPECVILVASVYEEYRKPALAAGANAFMHKDESAKHRAMITAIFSLLNKESTKPDELTRLLQNVAEG